jgi:hypothetical protein
METVMTASKPQKAETKTETKALSETQLGQVTGGIIAVLRPTTQLCDGSVRPADTQSQKSIIAI